MVPPDPLDPSSDSSQGKEPEKTEEDPTASEAQDAIRHLLGPDLRSPVGIPKGYTPSDSVSDPMFRVELSDFAGPMDLLLYLIRKHDLDVLDVPITFVTQRYLAFLDELRSLQIDVASEFLVLAAELTHIKSKMLLPAQEGVSVEEEEEEEGDPRAELVRRLLEYQKYRDAAHQLDDRDVLGRDVFPRVPPPPDQVEVDPGLKSVSVFRLVELMAKMLRRTPVRAHEIEYEVYSIGERIRHVAGFGRERDGKFTIDVLLTTVETRSELVITFIAVLEMTRLGLVKLFIEEGAQAEAEAEPPASEEDLPTIWVHLTDKPFEGDLLDDYRS